MAEKQNNEKDDTVSVTSQVFFRYNGRQIKPGETLRVAKDEVDDLVATQFVTTDKGRYNRRDMRANR